MSHAFGMPCVQGVDGTAGAVDGLVGTPGTIVVVVELVVEVDTTTVVDVVEDGESPPPWSVSDHTTPTAAASNTAAKRM